MAFFDIVPNADMTVGFVPVGTGNTVGVIKVAGFKAAAGIWLIPMSHLLFLFAPSVKRKSKQWVKNKIKIYTYQVNWRPKKQYFKKYNKYKQNYE